MTPKIKKRTDQIRRYRPLDKKIDIDYLIAYLMTKRGKDILKQ